MTRIAAADWLALLAEPAVLVSASGRILSANYDFCTLLELRPEQAEQASLLDFCSAREAALEYLRACSAVGQPLVGALTLLGPSGPRTMRCRAGRLGGPGSDLVLLRLQGKKTAGRQFVALNRQITTLQHEVAERRRIEQSLRELAAIVESSEDAIISKDLDGTITSWNRAAERIFGYTAAEALGQPSTVLIPPENLAEELAVLERVAGGERLAHYETLRRRKDGALLQVSLTVSPIKDAAGRIVGTSKIARDITGQKQTERALAEAREKLRCHAEELERCVAQRTSRLQETIRSLDGLCYTMAHDLRAPLRAMVGFSTELLERYRPVLDQEGCEYADRIKKAALLMDQLILDLLEYGRLNTIDIPLSTIRLEAVLNEALAPLQLEIAQRGAQVHIQEPLLPVRGNEIVFRQVLSNLVGNALKFVRPEVVPKIEVWTEERDHSTRVLVKDNGIGIKAKYADKLFQPFVRLVRQDQFPGTGIGLAIVRKAAERMGGRAGFQSEYGRGSTFWVEVPTD